MHEWLTAIAEKLFLDSNYSLHRVGKWHENSWTYKTSARLMSPLSCLVKMRVVAPRGQSHFNTMLPTNEVKSLSVIFLGS